MAGCKPDCSRNFAGVTVPENQDISGIGVVLGYTVTAGITIAIIVCYYFVAHEPKLDPFRKETGDTESCETYRAHHVDEMILSTCKNLRRKIFGRKNFQWDTHSQDEGYQRALLKCVLLMSDTQILTGLAIMISGYTQLRCGLSNYHWNILVYLAWFSTLTHLSCLTFMRNYLFNHPIERIWRLTAMGSLVIMLIAAIVPNGSFTTQPDASPAICYYGFSRVADFTSVMVPVLLVGLGFISRVIKLHRRLSVDLFAKMRSYISDKLRRLLRKVYKRCRGAKGGNRFTSSQTLILLFYRPMLVLFLTMRALTDLWTSLAYEICWLLTSYAWGIVQLLSILDIDAPDTSNNKIWTFGQIVPVLLLLAPILSLCESILEHGVFLKALNVSHARVAQANAPSGLQTMEMATEDKASLSDGVSDDPDHNYYDENWYRIFTIIILALIMCLTTYVVFFPTVLYAWTPEALRLSVLIGRADIGSFIWLPLVFMISCVAGGTYAMLLSPLCRGLKLLAYLIWVFILVSGIILPQIYLEFGFLLHGVSVLIYLITVLSGSKRAIE